MSQSSARARNRLDGRFAIVTGAGIGMGAVTAQVMAGYGARVVVADLNRAAGEETVASIISGGGEAHFVSCNMTDEAQVEALVAQTVDRFGRLDCAVKNAAITPDTLPISEADMAA